MSKQKNQHWVFLRGLSRETAHWEGFLEAFAKRFPQASVTALDLPGNGEHFGVETPLALSGITDFLRKELQAKHPAPGQPVTLFALSLGAMAALHWMQTYPDEVAAGVFVNTSFKGISPFYKRLSPGAYPALVRMFADRSAKRREGQVLGLTSQHRDWDEQTLERRAQIQTQRPVSRKNAFRQILAAALSKVNARRKPPQPVLILNSLGDLLVHPDCSKTLAKIWDAPLRRHAWAGHDLPLDDPQWTLDALEQWVKGLGASANARRVDKSSA